MSRLWSFLLFSVFVGNFSQGEITCRDDNGNPVDWYYAYKLPKNSSSHNSHIITGDAYVFLLSNGSRGNDWTLSSYGASDGNSMLGRTVAPAYASPKDNDLVYVLYNDEKPDGSKSSSRGHTKGVLVLDKVSGFWLIHSVPMWPPYTTDRFSYPHSGLTYGQSFLCITLKTSDADVIGTQFQYNIPNYYDWNMPSWSEDALPNLYDAVINNYRAAIQPYYNVVDFLSSGRTSFKSFAKYTNYGKDLYADLVAPTLQSDLSVETWNHGSGELDSTCSPLTVKNVEMVYISAVGYSFTNSHDHSKWAVAPSTASSPWICVGDINRMESQESRAGGTVCAALNVPWRIYSAGVVAVEPCPQSETNAV